VFCASCHSTTSALVPVTPPFTLACRLKVSAAEILLVLPDGMTVAPTSPAPGAGIVLAWSARTDG
jgi:hypothetical protein